MKIQMLIMCNEVSLEFRENGIKSTSNIGNLVSTPNL